jgi:hypothetical protein
MLRKNYRNVLIIVGVAALAVIYIQLWQFMVANPVELNKKDFLSQYTAGKIANSGDWGNVYNLNTQIAQQEKITGSPIVSNNFPPFMHPPFILPLLALIANFAYVPAYHLWAILQIIFILLSAWVLLRPIPLLKSQKVIFASILLFFPVFISILSGQDSTILLLGLSLWAVGLLSDKDGVAGIGLAMVTIRPQIALILVIPFLFKRRKVLWWFLGSAAILGVLSIALIGIKGAIGFFQILGISVKGEGYFLNETAMINFLGLLKRWLPVMFTNAANISSWVMYIAVAVLLCLIWIRSSTIGEKQIGLAVLLAIFAAPHLQYHDLAALLIPVICLMSLINKAQLWNDLVTSLLPLGISWILFMSNFNDFFKYNVPYLIGISLGLMLCYPGILSRRHTGRDLA